MKMRKLLAVVLAVTMAISAMALSAFAEDIEIDLYNYSATTSDYTATYTITVPAYALYGYASQGDYLEITLPTNLSADTTSDESVVTSYALYDSNTGLVTDVVYADVYDAATVAAGNSYADAGYFPVYDGGDPAGIAWYDNDAANYDPSYVSSETTFDLSNIKSSSAWQGTIVSGDCTSRNITLEVTYTIASGQEYYGFGTITDHTWEGHVTLQASEAVDNGDGTYTQTITTADLIAAGADLSDGIILNTWSVGTVLTSLDSLVITEETSALVSTCVDVQATTIITPETYASGDYGESNPYATAGYVAYTYDTVTTSNVPTSTTQVIDYYLTVNGVTVKLQGVNQLYGASWGTNKTIDGSTYGFYTQKVEIGTFARDYTWAANSTEYNAMVPQSTMVSDSTLITITAVVDYSADVEAKGYDCGSAVTCDTWELLATWWPVWSDANGYGISIVYKDSTGTPVGEVLGTGMTVDSNKEYGSETTDDVVVVIADVGDGNSTAAGYLYWDHTLLNRSAILNAVNTEGATAKVVVDLDGTINGFAVYTLTAYTDVSSSSVWVDDTYWYDSSLGKTTASTYVLAGESTSQLVFEDVPLSALYDSTYGAFNSYMTVTQAVTAEGNSSYNYKYYTNSDDNSLEATAVTLVITMPDDDETLEVKDPVEQGDTDTEDEGTDNITVNEPEDVEPETNPTTGIVLALVPMAVAAAAAVASKRR